MTLMAVERKWGGVDNLTSEWENREGERKGKGRLRKGQGRTRGVSPAPTSRPISGGMWGGANMGVGCQGGGPYTFLTCPENRCSSLTISSLFSWPLNYT